LDIFDTAGHDDFSNVRDQYVRSGHGFLCVYSIIDMASFKEVPALYDHVLRVIDAQKIPFVVAGNKCDLEENREVTEAAGLEIAKRLDSSFFEVSAKTKKNVTEAFTQLVREIKKTRKRRSTRASRRTSEVVSNNNNAEKNKKCIIL
jgi:GTPase KRas protein